MALGADRLIKSNIRVCLCSELAKSSHKGGGHTVNLIVFAVAAFFYLADLCSKQPRNANTKSLCLFSRFFKLNIFRIKKGEILDN